jgi:hypothetical protein
MVGSRHEYDFETVWGRGYVLREPGFDREKLSA